MATRPQTLLPWVVREVHRCRPLALGYFQSRRLLRVERKPDRSPVTAADRAIEERLRRALARGCPGEPVVGEEFGAPSAPGPTYWTIDPIDGTRAFSRGLPFWGILVGRVERGRPTLGVCDFPALNLTLAVAPRIPAHERVGRSVKPFPRPRLVRSLDEAVILHGGAHWWARTPYARGFARVVASCYLERAYGDCYGHLWVLRGLADAVIEYGVKVWDMVPFAAMAQATGRAMVDVQGRSCFIGPESLMAHPTVAGRIARMLRAP